MLSKLLKHEFEALARYYAIIGIVMGAVTLFYKGYLLLSLSVRSDFFVFLDIFMGATYCIVLFGCLFASTMVLIIRFYKNLVTDEGYLTFTLPVSVRQILLSKLISALCMSLLTGLLAVFSVVILRKNIPDLDEIFHIMAEEFLRMTKDGSGKWFFAAFLIYIAAAFIYSMIVFYTSIALGQTCRNHKVLYSVLFYFAIYMITQVVIGLIFIITFVIKCHTFDSIIEVTAGIMTPVLFVCSAGILILGSVCFFLMDQLFSKKLNLE